MASSSEINVINYMIVVLSEMRQLYTVILIVNPLTLHLSKFFWSWLW